MLCPWRNGIWMNIRSRHVSLPKTTSSGMFTSNIRYKNKSFLTDEESMRMKEIKLKKLSLKDRMYAMMADFRKSLS
jgi:hypothetical protein